MAVTQLLFEQRFWPVRFHGPANCVHVGGLALPFVVRQSRSVPAYSVLGVCESLTNGAEHGRGGVRDRSEADRGGSVTRGGRAGVAIEVDASRVERRRAGGADGEREVEVALEARAVAELRVGGQRAPADASVRRRVDPGERAVG